MNIQSINYLPLQIQLPDDLWLNTLIRQKNETQILTFLKSHHLDLAQQKTVIKVSIGNSWHDILEWLFNECIELVPVLMDAIISKDQLALEILLKHIKGNLNNSINGRENETLLWFAINERNYPAVNALIKAGANFNQEIPTSLYSVTRKKFEKILFKNNPSYDINFFLKAALYDYENSLVFALAYHYYPQDSAALDILLQNPKFISLRVLKAVIQLADTSAFKKLLPFFINDKDVLLKYVLGDFQFCLMSFNFEYILPRWEILKSIVSLKPSADLLNHYLFSSFEIAQYLKMFPPANKPADYETVLDEILQDPTGLHEVWGIQRLLINYFGIKLPFNTSWEQLQIATYPSVHNYLKDSTKQFFPNNEWLFVTPSREFTLVNCLKSIQEKKILKFFTGWSLGGDGHAINVVIYHQYLFVCNRGQGSAKDTTGICIYRIEDESTLEMVVQLCLDRSIETEKFFTSDLINHPKINLLKHINCKQQKVGNCVWLSEKMGVYACFIAENLKSGDSLEEASKRGKSTFKNWSGLDRLNLITAYTNHPYHANNYKENKKKHIYLSTILSIIIRQAPLRLQTTTFDLILTKLNDLNFKNALDGDYDQLVKNYKLGRLTLAIYQQDTSTALAFLDDFPQVNKAVKGQETLLHLTCKYHNVEVAEELIKRGAEVHALADKKYSPIDMIFKGKERQHQNAIMKYMVELTDFNKLAQQGNFPLHTAILEGDVFAVEQILIKGYDRLHEADGTTALHYAAMCKSESLSRLLLETWKDDINTKTTWGKTPLFYAVKENVLHGVQILLKLGADINVKTPENATVFHEISTDSQLNICKLLIDNGVDINDKGPRNSPPLINFINSKNEALVELMINQPTINLKILDDFTGYTPTVLAIQNGMVKIVKILLEKGCDPNCTNQIGNTLLHIAVLNNNVEICKLLLAAGANKSLVSLTGETPLDLAKIQNNEVLINLLSS